MTTGKEGEKPPQELTPQRTLPHTESDAPSPLPEQDSFSALFWDRFITKASLSPSGEDPAFWPLKMLFEFEDLIIHRGLHRDPATRELAEKLTPLDESIQRVKLAYAIIAYPQCKKQNRRRLIEQQLEADRQRCGRDQVELNDAELGIVQKLCETPRSTIREEGYANPRTIIERQPPLPFNPHRRTYNYSAVPISPSINPHGRRHMTTEEIRNWLALQTKPPKA